MNGEQGGNGGGEKSGMMGFESGKQGREDRPLAVNRLTPTTHRIDDERFGSPRGCGDHGTSVERSEEHTSELQSLMRISYAVFGLKKKKNTNTHTQEKQQ